MVGKLSVVLGLCALVMLPGSVYADKDDVVISWGGGDGSWTDQNWTDGTGGMDYIEALVGKVYGSDGAKSLNLGETIVVGSGTVEYPANDLQDDFRVKQGSDLIITGGATWIQDQDDSWSENRWTEMDLSTLILDNGTFRRVGAVGAEGGGALIFGSWRGDDNSDVWLPNQETSIEIINGGRLENEGSLWFSSADDVLPDSVFNVTINNGTIDLTGGEYPPAPDEEPTEADLIFFGLGNTTEFNVNFTGPGSITVDESGIAYIGLNETLDLMSYEDLWDMGILQANGQSGPDGAIFTDYFTTSGVPGGEDYMLSWREGAAVQLQPGDADQDLDFDQFDLIKVQQAAKYLSGQAATWGEGDWDGGPGGSVGDPPVGNGLFDQLDIIKALSAGKYLTGPYGALSPDPGDAGDEQTSIVYDPNTGELGVDAPASTELTSINIDSAAGIFTGDPAQNLGGSFDNDADNNIFKATFGSSFGSLSFGTVAQAGLSEEFVRNDLTAVGSLAGGGDLGNVDLIYVPEPSTVVLLMLGLLGLARCVGCRRR